MNRAFGRSIPSKRAQESSTSTALQITLNEKQRQQLNGTKRHLKTSKVIGEFNRKIMSFISFLVELVSSSTGILGDASIDDLVIDIDPDTYVEDKESLFLGHNRHRVSSYRKKDLVYEKLDPKLPQLFVTSPSQKYLFTTNKKTKEREIRKNTDGVPIQKGFDSHRKFFQALVYGCELTGNKFTDGYTLEIEKFRGALKKEKQLAKGSGEVEEKDSDPISFPLFMFMCDCAVKLGDPLWWAMGLLQWHCMARCQNIDNLKIRNFSVVDDAIVIKFFDTKMDKVGEKLSPKHCYANPSDFRICVFTALACYFCMVNSEWTNKRDYLFINDGASTGSAASNYTDRIKAWITLHVEKVQQFIRPNHGNAYGLRKGSATQASSNTTAPPPLASIFHRGEWSLGVVLDVYWRYADAGDQYLGRILAGLDPNNTGFDVLPPHFIVDMSNEDVKHAMQLCFAKILNSHGDEIDNGESFLPALLFRCLASFVYHSDAIRKVIAQNEGHPFSNIPLFQNLQLLEDLKKIVTVEPTEGILSKATGIPPHTQCIKGISQILQKLDEYHVEREDMFERMKHAVDDAFEKKALENGQLTAAGMHHVMESYHKLFAEQNKKLEHKIDLLATHGICQGSDASTSPTINTPISPSTCKMHSYVWDDGNAYFVPKTFSLPDQTPLKSAFCQWVNGNQGYTCVKPDGTLQNTPVRPFQLWTHKHIPDPIWKKFKVGWKKILDTMMEADGLKGSLSKLILEKGGEISDEKVNELYDIGLAHVIDTVTYIKKKQYVRWRVTTWSKSVQRSEILKSGTAEDKLRLKAPTRYNNKHSKKRKMKGSNRKAAKQRRISLPVNEV